MRVDAVDHLTMSGQLELLSNLLRRAKEYQLEWRIANQQHRHEEINADSSMQCGYRTQATSVTLD